MPELPEVETVCRGLAPVMTGSVIARVETRREGLRQAFPATLKDDLEGVAVTHITRRAKYILIHMENGFVLVLHLGMSGRIQIEDPPYMPQNHDHFLLYLDGAKGQKIIVLHDPRRFGMVLLIREDALATHPSFRHLGPEPLSNEFNGPFLAERLRGKTVAVKTALMDQRVVVGVGNIYASEALFLAGISPNRKAGSVTGQRAEKLVQAIRVILEKAIAAGGSTLQDHRQVDGDLGYFQHAFAVYGRIGQACPGCNCDIVKTKGIMRIVQNGRASFYCPRKQK